jgi:hypothetical protein
VTITVTVETEIPAPLPKVWRTLIDFERYGQWHPHHRISGLAEPGARVVMLFGDDDKSLLKIPAKIVAFEPEQRVVFRTGRPVYGRAFETMEVVATHRGVRLRHSAEVPLWSAWLKGGRAKFEAGMTLAYRQVGAALVKQIAKDRAKTSPGRAARRSRISR